MMQQAQDLGVKLVIYKRIIHLGLSDCTSKVSTFIEKTYLSFKMNVLF